MPLAVRAVEVQFRKGARGAHVRVVDVADLVRPRADGSNVHGQVLFVRARGYCERVEFRGVYPGACDADPLAGFVFEIVRAFDF